MKFLILYLLMISRPIFAMGDPFFGPGRSDNALDFPGYNDIEETTATLNQVDQDKDRQAFEEEMPTDEEIQQQQEMLREREWRREKEIQKENEIIRQEQEQNKSPASARP